MIVALCFICYSVPPKLKSLNRPRSRCVASYGKVCTMAYVVHDATEKSDVKSAGVVRDQQRGTSFAPRQAHPAAMVPLRLSRDLTGLCLIRPG
jgi:hypothetical protein